MVQESDGSGRQGATNALAVRVAALKDRLTTLVSAGVPESGAFRSLLMDLDALLPHRDTGEAEASSDRHGPGEASSAANGPSAEPTGASLGAGSPESRDWPSAAGEPPLDRHLLEIERARLKQLVAATQDAVIFIDSEGRIVRFNRAAETVFGFRVEELLGQPVTILMPEPYRSEHPGYIERYERTGEARAIGRIRVVQALDKTGRVFPIELSVTALRVDGDDVRYAAFIRDISEKAELQEKLIERERLASIGMSASMFAHEVGNPLNNLYLQAQMLERRLKKLHLPSEVASGARDIIVEIRRMSELLSDFRSFSRREALDLKRVDVASLVEDVLRLHEPRDASSAIQVRSDLDENLPQIQADSGKLKQVFINLCKNSIEAMPNGGTLTVRAKHTDGAILIEVVDTGVGLPPSRDVFEAFMTTKPQGTGLGLPIVREIVTAHGGTVSCSSTAGKGTTFTVALPVAVDTG